MKVVLLLTQDRGGPVDLTVSLAQELAGRTGGPRSPSSGRPLSPVPDSRGASCTRRTSGPSPIFAAWQQSPDCWRYSLPTSSTRRIGGPAWWLHWRPGGSLRRDDLSRRPGQCRGPVGAGRPAARSAARASPAAAASWPTRSSLAGSPAPSRPPGPSPGFSTASCGCLRRRLRVLHNGVAIPSRRRHGTVSGPLPRWARSRPARPRRCWSRHSWPSPRTTRTPAPDDR